MRTALVSFTCLLLVNGGAQAIDSHSKTDILYGDAREVFLQRGYHPYVMPGSDKCDEGSPRCYPELEFCVHKRRWICTYAWEYEKTIFQVETKSDTPILDSFYCVVNCTEAGGAKPSAQLTKPPVAGAEVESPAK